MIEIASTSLTLKDEAPPPAARPFTALAEEFNKSAQSAANQSGTTMEALLMKYSLLKKFKVETAADQIALSGALFEGGLGMLRRCVRADFYGDLPTNDINTVFKLLLQEKEAPFLPVGASDRLVDAALDLIRRSEAVQAIYSVKEDRIRVLKSELVKLAGTVGDWAEALRGVSQNAESFTPAKAIAPPKKLSLTQAQVIPQ